MSKRIHVGRASVLILAVWANSALDAQGTRQQLVFGSGQDECGTWVAARATASRRSDSQITQSALLEEWLRGFVSGYAAAHQTLKPSNSQTLATFVDAYCRDHPTVRLYDAALALVRDLPSAPQLQCARCRSRSEGRPGELYSYTSRLAMLRGWRYTVGMFRALRYIIVSGVVYAVLFGTFC